MIDIILTIVLFLLVFAALTDLVLLLRPSTLAGALAPALACFVGLESVLLNGLSLFYAVDRFWLAAVHLVLLFVWLCFILYYGRLFSLLQCYWFMLRRLSRTRSVQLLFPLLILLTITAVLYPPNTYDVLTYHMARVVHWMQNESIAYYPTAIDRQNVLGPGAEYLLLFFQLFSMSDYLANKLQLFAFIILVISMLHILRLFKIRGAFSGWIMILVVTAPIAIMEASSAKNDLVAAVMAVAVIISSIRFLIGDSTKITLGEYGLAGICLGSAFLVKPTALLASVPVVAVGIFLQFSHIFSKVRFRQLLAGGAVLTFAVIIVAGPDIVRKQQNHVSRHEVYHVFNDYTVDRMWNPLRHFAHNTPFPEQTVSMARYFGYRGELITKDVFNFQEDMVGNPFQVSALVVASGLSLLIWFLLLCKSSHIYPLLLSISPVFSWVVFGFIIKDQGWLTRLQIPLFCLLPLSFVYLSQVIRKRNFSGLLLKIVFGFAALVSLSYATLVATHVPPRQLVLSYFWGEEPGRTDAYYRRIPSLKADHDAFFQKVEESGCKRVGLILGPDSVDYPLTWRAVKSDIETRYLRGPVYENGGQVWHYYEKEADWPCVIYAGYGVPEHVPDRGRQYLPAGDYHTYFRNLQWEFEQSSQVSLLLNKNEVAQEMKKQGTGMSDQGVDPQLILPLFLTGSARSAVMKVSLESFVDTELQLFYMTEKLPYYTEHNSIRVKSKKGENNLYFFLPVDDIVGAIRLDPGSQAGICLLNEIEVRTIDSK